MSLHCLCYSGIEGGRRGGREGGRERRGGREGEKGKEGGREGEGGKEYSRASSFTSVGFFFSGSSLQPLQCHRVMLPDQKSFSGMRTLGHWMEEWMERMSPCLSLLCPGLFCKNTGNITFTLLVFIKICLVCGYMS